MTMEELKTVEDDFLTASQAAGAMKMDTGRLIGYAKAGQLPFPVMISGNRVKIPRIAFLKHYGLIEDSREKDDRLDRLLKEAHNANVALTAANMMLMGILSEVAPERFKGMQEQIRTMKEGLQ